MIKREKIRTISMILFVIYMVVLVYFLLLSDNFGRTNVYQEYNYNLIPFKEIKRFIVYRRSLSPMTVFVNLFGNVLAFMPFGALIRWVRNKKTTCMQAVFYTFSFSLCVELLQLITKAGICDVDDLILNTFGGFLGYMLYLMLRGINKRREKNGNQKGL